MKPCIAVFQHGWADWEAGFVLSGLQDDLGIEVRVATPSADVVKSIGGVRALADLAYSDIDPDEASGIVVIGSGSWRTFDDAGLSSVLRRADARGVPLGAICAGTLAAARAGLLDDRPHTSNAAGMIQRFVPAYRGVEHYQDCPRAVVGRNLVTAPGTAPITFAVEFFRLIAPDQDEAIRDFDQTSRRELATY